MTVCGQPGFPIQKSTGQRIFGSSPWLIAAYHVFHRLPMPRHPPVALFILAFFILVSIMNYFIMNFFLSIPIQLSKSRTLRFSRTYARSTSTTLVVSITENTFVCAWVAVYALFLPLRQALFDLSIKLDGGGRGDRTHDI